MVDLGRRQAEICRPVGRVKRRYNYLSAEEPPSLILKQVTRTDIHTGKHLKESW